MFMYVGKSVKEVTGLTSEQFNEASEKVVRFIFSLGNPSIVPGDVLKVIMDSYTDPATRIALSFTIGMSHDEMTSIVELNYRNSLMLDALKTGKPPVFPGDYNGKSIVEVTNVSNKRLDVILDELQTSVRSWMKKSITPGDCIEMIMQITEDQDERLCLCYSVGRSYYDVRKLVESSNLGGMIVDMNGELKQAN